MPKLPPFDDVIAAFVRGGATALGSAAASSLGERIRSLWSSLTPSPSAPRISPIAVDTYLHRRAFAPFVKDEVERWVLWQVAEMPRPEASALLLAVATASNGDLNLMLRALAQHFRSRL